VNTPEVSSSAVESRLAEITAAPPDTEYLTPAAGVVLEVP